MKTVDAITPKWFHRIDAFLFHSCSIVFIQALINSGYLNGINTTLERRYKLTTHEIGLIYMWYELTSTPSTILFGIFGKKLHRPRVIGFSSFIIALGMFLFTIPHFMTPNYDMNICQEYYNHTICMKNGSKNIAERSSVLNTDCQSEDTNSPLALSFFCLGSAVLGLGSSPLFVLCLAHLWDNLTVKQYSVYAAIFYLTIGIGSPFGFVVSGAILNIFIDVPLTPKCPQLTPKHSLWLGAWWIGLLIMGGMLILLAVPMFKFQRSTISQNQNPRPLEPESIEMIEEEKDASQIAEIKAKDSNSETNITVMDLCKLSFLKESLQEFYSLLKNKIFVFITLSNVMEQSVALASVTFISKYIQMVYAVPVADASFVVAAIIVPGVAVGLVLGGLMMRHMQPSFVSINKILLVWLVITTCLLVYAMSLRCQDNYYYKDELRNKDEEDSFTAFKNAIINILQKAIGKNKYLSQLLQQNKQNIKPTHIDNQCNSKCVCDLGMYEPLCDKENSLDYYSPCHAGCNFIITNKPAKSYIVPPIGQVSYSNCSCAPNSTLLVSGHCRKNCSSYYHLVILLAFTVFFTCLGQVPINIVSLSVVPPSSSSMALGVQVFCVHMFAFIPIPIIFGVLFDYACVLRVSEKCTPGSICNEYDLNKLPYVWLGSIIVLKSLSIVFCGTSFLISRKIPKLNGSLSRLKMTGIQDNAKSVF